MPEIGEVARIVHFLRKHLVKRRITTVTAQEDPKIYNTAKTGLTSSSLSSGLQGKTVVDAGQQGKYFWIVMDQPPHLLMHFGMTGWIKFNHDETAYYKPQRERKQDEKKAQQQKSEENGSDDEDTAEQQEWPPRFWKFVLATAGDDPPVEAAFVDARRFGRVQLLECPAAEIRRTSPLKENGPDPVVDRGLLTAEWLANKLQSKRVPVKALLLDQFCISGIGNWVADEILFQARVHPEQYSNTLSREQAGVLHEKMMEVCGTACELLADSERFPGHWLMKHRWDKGKKGGSRLPTGEKIEHLSVGGRTSAVVPSLQKKTGAVAGDVVGGGGEEGGDGEDEKKTSKRKSPGGKGRTAIGKKKEPSAAPGEENIKTPASNSKKRKSPGSKDKEKEAAERVTDEGAEAEQQKAKKKRTARTMDAVSSSTPPRRRSARHSK